jgi:hypothetical protein
MSTMSMPRPTEANSSPNSAIDCKPSDRAALLDALRIADELERRHCADDPEYWIFKYARTRDEHDPEIAAKPFPDKKYLRDVARFWVKERMNLYEKSRQMMVTWILCALYAHDAQFHTNRLNFIQSKKEEDSDRLIQRCFTIYENQPSFLKNAYRAEYSYCHLRFFRAGNKALPYSEIWGIPQGGDVIRQHTGSGLFIDEGGFQVDLEAVGAAQPMLKGGGRLDIVSSAEPGYFEELVEDRVK